MNFIKSTIIVVGILFHLSWAVQVTAQQSYVELNDSAKIAVQEAVDSMIISYTNINSFVDSAKQFDMDIKRSYLDLFEERADVLFDFKSSAQTVKIEEYANTISLKLREISDDIAFFPYKREPVDSVRYDKLDGYYQVPVKLHKVLNYTLNPQDSIIKKVKAINLKLFVNVYEDGERVKIAGIVADKSAIVWKDCKDVENGKAIIGSICDDCKGKSINAAVYQFDCSCYCIDCEGTEDGEATIGTSCDDNDEVTTNDIYDKNCNCIGSCSEDEAKKKGDACDDEDETTLNDFYQDNCTCMGSEEDCAGEKGGTALFGSPCDDGEENNQDDRYNNNCECIGVDCKGVEGGSALKGSACDDGNDKTENDVYQSDCACKGKLPPEPEPVDCEGEVNGSNLPGTPCNDNNKNTIKDRYQEDCTCIGEIKNSYGVYAGAAAILPLTDNESVETKIGYNLAGGIHFSPANMEKLLFKVGVAYLPYDATLSIDSSRFSRSYNNSIFGVSIDKVIIDMDSTTNINENLSFKMLQIPVSISYQILNTKKAGLYVDVFAKPNLVVGGDANYNFSAANIERYDVIHGFGSPLILKEYGENNENGYDENNEILRNYDEYADSTFTSKSIQLNKTPIAIGGGLSYRHQVGKQNYINVYLHYNQYLSAPVMKLNDTDVEGKIDVLDALVDPEISSDMINIPLDDYFKESKNASIEFGVHYLIKF